MAVHGTAGDPAGSRTSQSTALYWSFPGTALDVSLSRRWLAAAAEALWGAGEDTDRLVLAYSEVVTNAVVHGRGPVTVSARLRADGAVCEVADCSAHPPRSRRADPEDVSGRGLDLLRQSVDRLRVIAEEIGKTVRFEVARGSAGSGGSPPRSPPRVRSTSPRGATARARRTARPVESVRSAESARPVESVRSAESARPVESVASARPEESAESAEWVGSAGPADKDPPHEPARDRMVRWSRAHAEGGPVDPARPQRSSGAAPSGRGGTARHRLSGRCFPTRGNLTGTAGRKFSYFTGA
ncbi:ATP-binding protein [Catenulispora yoronensis]